jgi:hypothetical protein
VQSRLKDIRYKMIQEMSDCVCFSRCKAFQSAQTSPMLGLTRANSNPGQKGI